jgi:hypothetical protein
MPTIHIHLDESGNFDFSPKGTSYYVFAAAWTYDPAPLARRLQALRYRLLKQGHDVACFHATEDRQEIRDAVLNLIGSDAQWRFCAIVVDKKKVHPTLRLAERFYPRFAAVPIRFVLRGRLRHDTSLVLIYTDKIPVKRNRQAVEKAIKLECSKELGGRPFYIHHHPSTSNSWLQIVDYACWGVFRKWEQRDLRTYDRLKDRLAAPELDVLYRGSERYY